ncbi:zinc ribbon domain-containing protein [Methanosphaera sp.]|uniref:zinc ribbon domain-containing protein n=1 Tax=Methanosphaera sp. TaxID=2666342 RepID=UPI0025DAF903|nr:zinc ribbon domain-containing protein [Methanosphaera sp.]
MAENIKKKGKNKTLGIVILLLVLYFSLCGQYLNSGNDYFYEHSKEYALIDLLIISTMMMIVPFIWRLINKEKFELRKGKKICLWNSIILFVISMILMTIIHFSFIGGIGAIMYYFINKWLFVNYDENKEEKEVESKKEFICTNCGALCHEEDKYCKKCNAIFEEEKQKKKKEVEPIVCSNCGTLITANEKECPHCGEKFEDVEEINKNNDNEYIKSNMSQEYDDLNKLKELLDNEIITKEEFEKEKKKILK